MGNFYLARKYIAEDRIGEDSILYRVVFQRRRVS
jgi:hypothetical protein